MKLSKVQWDYELCEAVKAGNRSTVIAALARGQSPDTLDRFKVPALSLAAFHGNISIVKLLLERDASVDLQASAGSSTALMYACENNHLEIVQLLIANRASVDRRNSRGATAMHLAMHGRDQERTIAILNCLIEARADIDALDTSRARCPPLTWAASNKLRNVVAYLLSAGARLKPPSCELSAFELMPDAVKEGVRRLRATLLPALEPHLSRNVAGIVLDYFVDVLPRGD